MPKIDHAAEGIVFVHLTSHFLTGFVMFFNVRPRVGLQDLKGQKNPAFPDINNFNFDNVIEFNDFLGVTDQAMIQLRHVDHTLNLGIINEFYKHPEIGDARH